MSKDTKGKSKTSGGYTGLFLVAAPVVALVATAILHWTMQFFLETNLWLRAISIVWLPIYITIAVVGPPLLASLCVWYFIRRIEEAFWVTLYVTTLIWGFWYLIPPIRENWGEFLIIVDWLSKT